MSRLPLLLGSLLFLQLIFTGCNGNDGKKPATPASEQPRVESALAITTLDEKARKSLQIESLPVRNREVHEHLMLTGWIMAKQGNEVTLTAPVGGYVRVASGSFPAAGDQVKEQQDLLILEPVLSQVEDVQMAALKRGVDGEVLKAKNTKETAEKELKRTEDLRKQGLRSEQELEQTKLKLDLAQEDLATALAKQKLFADPTRPKKITSPRAGTIVTVYASPGQYVAAAAPLLTLIDLSTIWIRVPVPEFDLPHVSDKQNVTVTLKNNGARHARARPAKFAARRLALVPLVDRERHTADLLYELCEPPAKERSRLPVFAKDQMVAVHVPLGPNRLETVVPYAAIVFDAFGGAWVYLEQGKDQEVHKFERRRVELGPEVEGGVVIRNGLAPPPALQDGEHVVVAGAAFLYSREFHAVPVKINAKKQEVDDDD